MPYRAPELLDYQKVVAATIATLLLCAAAWYLVDAPLAYFVRQFREAPWYGIWKAITLAGQSEWYLVAGLVMFAALWRWRRKASLAGLFLFASVAVSGLASDLVKITVGRARPKLLLEQGIYGFGGFHVEHAWTSFPSGHSATGMSVAVTLSLLFPRFRPLFMAGGLLIALSRLVLDQHYLSDVMAGSMLGIVTAILLYQRYFHTALDAD
ncbi:MAG: phosphatase PAP2 family protein [Chlorobiaceae bacterium]|nr:phosphatase PAP2 family protein [Chlorobiaceae bacterium]NTW73389.1 phosphatase PAP2 family protein [Chlorobiaceae bacterium]